MGFLDFLKKDKPPAPARAMPSAPGPQQGVSATELDDIKRKIGLTDLPPSMGKSGPASGSFPAPSSAPYDPFSAQSPRGSPIPPPLSAADNFPVAEEDDARDFADDDDFESVPIPPASLREQDFLASAAGEDSYGAHEEYAPPRAMTGATPQAPAQASAAPAAPRAPLPPPPAPAAAAPGIADIALPDFSDEDIAALERAQEMPPSASARIAALAAGAQSIPAPMPSPSAPSRATAPVLPPAMPAAPAAASAVKERIAPWEPPAPVPRAGSAPSVPPAPSAFSDDALPPPTRGPMFGTLTPATFLSSGVYFTLTEDIRGVRKILRINDEVLKEASLRHEKGDEQLRALAIEMNAVQERLMGLDAALFEE